MTTRGSGQDAVAGTLDVQAAADVLEALPHPALWIRADHEVAWMNRAAREAYAGRTGPCYALTHGHARPCDALGERCPMALVEARGEPAEVTHAHHGPDGSGRMLRVVAVPVAGGGVLEIQFGLGREVTLDPVSGLLRRECWLELARRDRALLQRIGGHYSVLFVDIDHFKRFNDTWGHAVGDEVLEHVGRAIRDRMRLCDSAGRFGGEEFVVFMPHTGAREALAAAERVRAAIGSLPLPVPEAGIRVTVSIGVHTTHPGEDLVEAVSAADAAMYAVKSAGRDGVRLSPGSAQGEC
jgi:diguanylate cyclase (GGDEF)-like protein